MAGAGMVTEWDIVEFLARLEPLDALMPIAGTLLALHALYGTSWRVGYWLADRRGGEYRP